MMIGEGDHNDDHDDHDVKHREYDYVLNHNIFNLNVAHGKNVILCICKELTELTLIGYDFFIQPQLSPDELGLIIGLHPIVGQDMNHPYYPLSDKGRLSGTIMQHRFGRLDHDWTKIRAMQYIKDVVLGSKGFSIPPMCLETIYACRGFRSYMTRQRRFGKDIWHGHDHDHDHGHG